MSTLLLSKLYELLTPKLGKEAVVNLTTYIESKNNDTLKELTEKFATKEDLAKVESRLIKWMFLFWIGQVAAIVGIMLIKN